MPSQADPDSSGTVGVTNDGRGDDVVADLASETDIGGSRAGTRRAHRTLGALIGAVGALGVAASAYLDWFAGQMPTEIPLQRLFDTEVSGTAGAYWTSMAAPLALAGVIGVLGALYCAHGWSLPSPACSASRRWCSGSSCRPSTCLPRTCTRATTRWACGSAWRAWSFSPAASCSWAVLRSRSRQRPMRLATSSTARPPIAEVPLTAARAGCAARTA